MSRTILGLVVIIVIVGGAYFLLHRGSGSTTLTTSPTPLVTATSNTAVDTATPTSVPTVEASAAATTQAQTVTYNADGTFSPASLTVKAGTTVSFKNDSSQLMWVASDPHPTHTDYPGFDALKGIANGETYSFTFTKTGTWGYHNHLKTSSRGTIIVQ